MTNVTNTTSCGKCGLLIEEGPGLDPKDRVPCAGCGSTLCAHAITVQDTATIYETIGLKGKRPGKKKPFVEQKSGDDLHRKSSRWMKVIRIIDRDNDHYSETVTDPETGEIVHHNEELLSKHTDHGSAKKR